MNTETTTAATEPRVAAQATTSTLENASIEPRALVLGLFETLLRRDQLGQLFLRRRAIGDQQGLVQLPALGWVVGAVLSGPIVTAPMTVASGCTNASG